MAKLLLSFPDGTGFERSIGRIIRGTSAARHPNTIAKAIVGRMNSDIVLTRSIINIDSQN